MLKRAARSGPFWIFFAAIHLVALYGWMADPASGRLPGSEIAARLTLYLPEPGLLVAYLLLNEHRSRDAIMLPEGIAIVLLVDATVWLGTYALVRSLLHRLRRRSA